jgi:hypothetical protein
VLSICGRTAETLDKNAASYFWAKLSQSVVLFLSTDTLQSFTHAPDRLHVITAVRKPLASLPRRVYALSNSAVTGCQ